MADAKTKGEFRGQVRYHYNILQQWTGRAWVRVENFIDEKDYWPTKLHFGPDEEIRENNPYAGDEAFLPTRR